MSLPLILVSISSRLSNLMTNSCLFITARATPVQAASSTGSRSAGTRAKPTLESKFSVRLFRITLEVGQLRCDQLFARACKHLSHSPSAENGLLEGEIDSAGRIRAPRLENPRRKGARRLNVAGIVEHNQRLQRRVRDGPLGGAFLREPARRTPSATDAGRCAASACRGHAETGFHCQSGSYSRFGKLSSL